MKKIIIILLVFLFFAACIGPKLPGDVCTTNEECSTRKCISGECSFSDVGEYCTDKFDCLNGNCVSNVCSLAGHRAECSKDADCISEYSCYNNQCLKKNDSICELNKLLSPLSPGFFLVGVILVVLSFLGIGSEVVFKVRWGKLNIAFVGSLLTGLIFIFIISGGLAQLFFC